MNWKTFFALLGRDGHVARRNLTTLTLQILFQPMLFVFVFGRVMTTSGLMVQQYKSMLVPGIVAVSMVFSGVWAVAMPLISEFQFTKEIEDRLLAPIEIEWVAVEKIVAGMLQALVAGLVVLPVSWLVMGGLDVANGSAVMFLLVAVLVAALAAAIGLTLGCTVGQNRIGLMFSLVITPMIFFGCTYYPWQALSPFPILQRIVLVNPLVYASEGFRAALVPHLPHLTLTAVFVALVVFNAIFMTIGLRQFRKKALG